MTHLGRSDGALPGLERPVGGHSRPIGRAAASDTRALVPLPEVRRYVLFVLGLFVCLDLIALVMKLSHLLIGGAVYEEVAAELRERDRLQAHRLREETAVLRKRITEEARADVDVDEARIDSERTRRIADEQAKFTPKPALS